MSPKRIKQLIILNTTIVLAVVAVFSKAFLGLSLLEGSTLGMTIAWYTVIASLGAFLGGNYRLLSTPVTHSMIAQKVNSLDDCVGVFEQAIQNGDVFDKDIMKNLEQLKRYKRKRNTIKDILLQKFSPTELTYQKFDSVLKEIENVIFLNMRSILNKIAAFDVEEYENLQKKGFPAQEVSEEKMKIYQEYLDFVKNATEINEEILLKLDKMLFEISKYNSLEDGDVKKLPAIVEMDELIKNAKLYR